jgi:hypothetical protein
VSLVAVYVFSPSSVLTRVILLVADTVKDPSNSLTVRLATAEPPYDVVWESGKRHVSSAVV